MIRFEQARLAIAGLERLAANVEHVSRSRGDHLGFDILSFEANGRVRLIEVKTTAFGKYTPFFVTQNELRISKAEAPQYQVYRVFDFRREPKMFELLGPIDSTCSLEPTDFTAHVGKYG